MKTLDIVMIILLVCVIVLGFTHGVAFLNLAALYRLGIAGAVIAVLFVWLLLRKL
jgi:hypothetical protein